MTRLTPAQRDVLRHLACGRVLVKFNTGPHYAIRHNEFTIYNYSAAVASTIAALQRHGYIDSALKLTDSGKAAVNGD